MNKAEVGNGTSRTPLKVLFVDPHGAFVTWGDALRKQGCDWDLMRVDDAKLAVELAGHTPFDAVIVASLSSLERELGALRTIASIKPKLPRILLSPALSAVLLAKALDVAHRTVLHNSDLSQVVAAVEQTVRVNQQLYRDKVVRSFAAFRQLPSPPAIYHELSRALDSNHTSAQDISAIVERDPALAARILQLVNSSYFGLNRKISNLTEALTLLGLRTVRGLALAGHLSAHYPDDRSWKVFSFTRMNQRSLSVARLAQDICGPYGQGQMLKDQVFLAGLLLDIGMLMLAAEQGTSYLKVLRFAARKQQPLHEVEMTAFGVTHAELGAYLLDLWNLSPLVVEAVLQHHNPDASVGDSFSPLTAVHIADALLPTVSSEFGGDLSASLSLPYLQRLKIESDLPRWQMLANGYRLKMIEADGASRSA